MVKTNQFSVTRHEKVANGLIGDQGLPGVFVLYELSPMMVKFTEKHRYVPTHRVCNNMYPVCNNTPVSHCLFRSFTHFLTGVCAIIGGVFTGQYLLSPLFTRLSRI